MSPLDDKCIGDGKHSETNPPSSSSSWSELLPETSRPCQATAWTPVRPARPQPAGVRNGAFAQRFPLTHVCRSPVPSILCLREFAHCHFQERSGAGSGPTRTCSLLPPSLASAHISERSISRGAPRAEASTPSQSISEQCPDLLFSLQPPEPACHSFQGEKHAEVGNRETKAKPL